MDDVTFDGSASDVLSVSATSPAASTDQNTPVSVHTSINTSLADDYQFTVDAPPGWTAILDSEGNATVTPAAGLQSGAFQIAVVAQSTTNPELIARDTVNISIGPSATGLNLTVAPDSGLSVPFAGAQLPTAFRALIQNVGPDADTFNLSFASLPTGFDLVTSDTGVTIPAGQAGILGLYLVPSGVAVPPVGTDASFSVTATSASDPSITATYNVSFTVPAVDAVSLAADPISLSSTPGTAVTGAVTITNVGNVSEDISLGANAPAGLHVSGLSAVTLAAGQSTSENITFMPDAGTPLGTTFADGDRDVRSGGFVVDPIADRAARSGRARRQCDCRRRGGRGHARRRRLG